MAEWSSQRATFCACVCVLAPLDFFHQKLQGIVAEIPSDSATSSRGRFLLFLC